MGTGAPEEYCSVLEVMQAWTMAFRSQISDVRLKCGDIYPENKKEIGRRKKKNKTSLQAHLLNGSFRPWGAAAQSAPGQEEPRCHKVL